VENNDEISSELVAEPKLENRFGIEIKRQVLSGWMVKSLMGGSALCLIGIFFFHTPEKPSQRSGGGIGAPEMGDLAKNANSASFDSYSETKENESIKARGKHRGTGIVFRLPGIQKIERSSHTQIPPGSQVRATLLSGATDGPVRAEVKEELKLQGDILVPAGATLYGRGQSTEDRLHIHFTKMTLKDGTTTSIQGDAADGDDQTVGLKGSKISRYAAKYVAAIGLNFVGGMAEGLQNRETVNGATVTTPDAKNALLNGTSRATFEAANEAMSNVKNQKPVIQVGSGREIFVMFDSNQ
jgi:hypothetical protein